ncbi:hypothetical protein [Cellulomonas dongxiuzhuiae]|uniref:hypothetical protein n=1 Tax=Cellulomonas dongxiuzhuiae TaxID=2819979 RepID=UPI001AAE2877|nr:hypothetical protein [Cellulomonas dongxiuzhuiae]MBO3090015.1 hypothetical protein [Cellulomonas dongxiuzhuiae]
MTVMPPDHDGSAPPAPPSNASPLTAPPSSRPTRPWLLPVATGAAGVLIGAGLVAGITTLRADAKVRAEETAADEARAARATIVPDAVESCGVTGAEGIVVADEGRSLTFDMKGDDDLRGANITDVVCVFTALDMPSAVVSHMDQTTSMDGRQSESWGDLTVSWSYHPDRGLDGVLTVADD